LCSIVLQLFSIVLVPFPPEYSRGGGARKTPAPHCEFCIRYNGNQLCWNFFQLYQPLFSITRGWFPELSPPPPLQISDSKQRESIVLQLCSIMLQLQCFSIVLAPFFNYWGGGSRNSVPHCEFWIRNNGNQLLCSIVLQFFSIVPTPFFNYQGVVSELRPPIANFEFETTRLNCALIMLNCAAIPFICAGSFFHDAITQGRILRNCTYFLFWKWRPCP